MDHVPVIDQYAPQVILASSVCPMDDLEAMQAKGAMRFVSIQSPSILTLTVEVGETGGKMEVRPSKDYDMQAGLMRITSLAAFSRFTDDSQRMDAVQVESAIDTASHTDFAQQLGKGSIQLDKMRLSSSACCALLLHLSRHLAVGQLPNSEPDLGGQILTVDLLGLDRMLHVTGATRRALSIFVEESVASAQSSSKKEGLSLFSLLNFTVSAMGRILLRRWLSWPSTEIRVITRRHEAVDYLCSPQAAADSSLLLNELRGRPNLASLLGSAFVRSSPSLATWRRLNQCCSRFISLAHLLRTLDGAPAMLVEVRPFHRESAAHI